MSLLEIKNLTTSFATEQGKVQAVRGISLSWNRERSSESSANPARARASRCTR